MTKILLAGATGLVGNEALSLLLTDERVTQVVAPTRRALAPHPKLLNPITDIATLPLDAPWWAVDGVISALGTTRAKTPSPEAYRAIDYGYALTIAKRARAGGATRFALVTSMGANAQSWFRYTRLKGELEEAIGRLEFPSLTILRPGFLGGNRRDADAMERVVGRVVRFMEPILPASGRFNPAKTVAALLVEAAISGKIGTHVINSAEIVGAADRTGD